MSQAEQLFVPSSTLPKVAASLTASKSFFQGFSSVGLPYRVAEEWQYNSANAESAELSDTFEILKPVDGHTDYQLLYNPVKEEAANLTSLPESPHSLRSTNSQDFVCPGDMFGATSAQHLMYSPQKAGCQPPIAGDCFFFALEHGAAPKSLTEAAGTKLPLKQEEIQKPDDSGMWAFISTDQHLEPPTATKALSPVGSSDPNYFDSAIGPFAGMVSSDNASGLGGLNVEQTHLVGEPSVDLDSPLSHLSESIFVGCTMPNFDRTERCTSLTPRQSTPEAAFQLPLELLPEDISEDLSDLSAPTIDLADVREPDPPESRRERSAAKRSSNKVDLDELDFVPHHTKRSRHVSKPKRTPRAASTEDDFSNYQPRERKKTAITARGRKVNRLQLSEEDNCEDVAETGNRRSKHHNPWTVEETEALVLGVESCGGGKWADIKKLGLRAIEKRSAVDLKDKWRNLQAALYRTKSDKKREIPASLLLRVKELVPLTATKARGEARANPARKQVRHGQRKAKSQR